MEFDFVVRKLVVALMNKGFTMATAEECTCGLIGATVASQEYAQRWYKGTITAYGDDNVKKLFGIPSYVTEKNGLISSQVAQQMALDTLYKFDVNIATSVMGDIDGYGKDAQICVAKMEHKVISFAYKKVIMGNDKAKNIETLITEALFLTLEHLEGKNG